MGADTAGQPARKTRITAAENSLLLLVAARCNAFMIETALPKAEPPKRKRRWFQFSLRTLLIGVTLLAVVCAYVAHEAKIVRARMAWLTTHPAIAYESGSHMFQTLVEGDRSKAPSALRLWLGDSDLPSWGLSRRDTFGKAAEISALFPEATVYWDVRQHRSAK
jgi:hypothetical protein